MIETIKVKKEEGLYNICGIIVKILNSGIYEVLISDDYKEFNLYKNDICRLSSELFRIISFSVLEKILGK